MRRLSAACDGDAVVIDAPREDRERVSLGVAERAGMCALQPAPGGRLRGHVHRGLPTSARWRRSAGWLATAAGARTARSRARLGSGTCRRRALLDHFGDARPGDASGRCCDVCDPGTIGLPDPASLTAPPRRRAKAAARRRTRSTRPLDALKEWRLAGERRQARLHGRAQQHAGGDRRAQAVTLDELATVKGVGPAFVERHGEQVLALLAAR